MGTLIKINLILNTIINTMHTVYHICYFFSSMRQVQIHKFAFLYLVDFDIHAWLLHTDALSSKKGMAHATIVGWLLCKILKHRIFTVFS